MAKLQSDLQHDAMVIEGLLAAMEAADDADERAGVNILIGIARAKAKQLNRDLDAINGSIPHDAG
ncbi:hypothetical protein [uncultured Roseovarius sp.]|uniref:hypothetical protein n=1 Tax=uncultured Roseovarius sp. TaxID=293344 RepID=UPI0026185DA4|nr:hypothetical protein [uncultured Roseovarius sp.]